MKKLFTIFSITCLLGMMVVSCEKDRDKAAAEYYVGSDKSLLKVNYVSQYAANPSVQIKLNEVRVSNLITARTPFPGGGFNTGGGSSSDYLAINPGQNAIKISIPNKGLATDSVVLFNSNINTTAGKNFTAHITDTGTNTKVVLLEDSIVQPKQGMSKFKFVNLMPNVPFMDLYYGTTLVASNVAYLGASPYFELAVTSPTIAWSIRETGSSPTSTALATYATFTHTNRRVYTAFASGYKGQPGTSTRRPFISFYLNY